MTKVDQRSRKRWMLLPIVFTLLILSVAQYVVAANSEVLKSVDVSFAMAEWSTVDSAVATGSVTYKWDGEDGDHNAIEHTGLGGFDVTGMGVRDHFMVAHSQSNANATMTIYNDHRQHSSHSFALTGDVTKVPFAAFSADMTAVGAIVLAVADSGVVVEALSADSSLTITQIDRPNGSVTEHELIFANNSAIDSAAITWQASLLGARMANAPANATVYSSVAHLPIGVVSAESTTSISYATETIAGGAVAVELVAQTGDAPPSLPAETISNFQQPFTSGMGKVGFVGDIATDDEFVWIGDDIIWSNSDAAPGNTLTGGESTMGIGNNGEFIYSPFTDGEDSVWTHNGLLLIENTQAPGFPNGTNSTFHSRATMTPDGTAYWISGFNASGGTTTEGRMVYKSVGAMTVTITDVLRAGDMVGGFTIGMGSDIGFDYDFSDNNTHHIHDLLVETGSTADDGIVYVNGAIVAREMSATGGGDNWDNFDGMSINNVGNYIFSGDTDGTTTSDEFVAYNGVIGIREGDTIDGIDLTTSASIRALSLNNLGEVAHIWAYNGTSAETLFVACDATDLSDSQALLTTNDMVDVDDNGSADATVIDFEASNVVGPAVELAENSIVYIAVELRYDGGGDVEAIIGVPYECAPSSVSGVTAQTGTISLLTILLATIGLLAIASLKLFRNHIV